jgi:osmotically-inducible protein OsmY
MDTTSTTHPLRLAAAALAGALALGAAGCDRPGPAEQVGAEAGRAIDQAAAKMGQAADSAGKTIGQIRDTTREQAADAAKSLDDASLAARVKSKLIAEAGPAGLAIDVTTARGVVTLQGTVDAPDVRERAGRAASGVDGVRSVENRLVVATGS